MWEEYQHNLGRKKNKTSKIRSPLVWLKISQEGSCIKGLIFSWQAFKRWWDYESCNSINKSIHSRSFRWIRQGQRVLSMELEEQLSGKQSLPLWVRGFRSQHPYQTVHNHLKFQLQGTQSLLLALVDSYTHTCMHTGTHEHTHVCT